MPRFNKKGPMGEGPMTGRRMGRCAHYDTTLNNEITSRNEVIDKSIDGSFPGEGLGRVRRRRMRRGMGQNREGRGMGRRNRFNDNF